MEDTAEKAKLKAKAKAMHEKVNMAKNEEQRIRLILNIITPDNYDRKLAELRGFLFGDLKTEEECLEAGDADAWANQEKLSQDNIREDILLTIVQNIFRKAQVEKEYCIFYGDLCEKLIKLELQLRGLEHTKMINQKQSAFRNGLFNVCKDCFDKFFSEAEIEKAEQNDERKLIFKTKLYGNLDFVGELFRRKMLGEGVLVSVFHSLLGLADLNIPTSDLNVEGATRLMNKVGQTYEERSKIKKKKQAADKDSQQQFNRIIETFEEFMDSPDEGAKISKRVKLLIKNMFTDRASGWKKNNDTNQGGPKTRHEVQKEVQEKYETARQAQEDERR